VGWADGEQLVGRVAEVVAGVAPGVDDGLAVQGVDPLPAAAGVVDVLDRLGGMKSSR